jgi:hypothetical protein
MTSPKSSEQQACPECGAGPEKQCELRFLSAHCPRNRRSSEKNGEGTPRTDDAEAEYHRWQEYAKQYGHLPEAMEQAPEEADPFWIARRLERQSAAWKLLAKQNAETAADAEMAGFMATKEENEKADAAIDAAPDRSPSE